MITTTTLKGVLFSAYSEVFLKKKPDYIAIATFLCLRRGVSNVMASKKELSAFSLPTQRCFPPIQTKDTPTEAFLCLRRGVFISKMITISSNALFSAYAEMFPLEGTTKHVYFACLCLRRGVSVIVIEIISSCYFSLPTQRCFPDIKQLFLQPILFSAYAEMFPSTQSEQSDVWAFLCLHRGVS